jgi:FkbM family methyltransferase
MKNQIKHFLQGIIFWNRLPLKFRINLQCLLYSNKSFKFQYRSGVFETKCFKKYLIFTYEPPFSFRYYNKLFLSGYFPQKGDIIIDAGAFDGHITCLFSQLVGNQGRIFTFECDPENINKCLKNIELNKIRNVTLINQGLWSGNTQIEFYSNSSVASSAFHSPPDSRKIKVNVTSIDQYFNINKIDKLDYVKMNIEGSEIQAISGAEFTLKKLKPKVAITADHTVDGRQTFKEVENILSEAGYTTKIRREGKGAIVVLGISHT